MLLLPVPCCVACLPGSSLLACGALQAHWLLQFSAPQEQECPDPPALCRSMTDLFDLQCRVELGPVNLDTVLKSVRHPAKLMLGTVVG